ncbi:hypothetical protein TNCV_72611 [Trichonephila clavipes]|uniref:Uncharacterized protein n=1 Tax=Trichonephila clavipes TaxID=2585209 RepID=A0A8X6UZS4_TRICX|nr:hypothetical protein TNCV_72611 [Trichonephila clavipes]
MDRRVENRGKLDGTLKVQAVHQRQSLRVVIDESIEMERMTSIQYSDHTFRKQKAHECFSFLFGTDGQRSLHVERSPTRLGLQEEKSDTLYRSVAELSITPHLALLPNLGKRNCKSSFTFCLTRVISINEF